MSEATELWQMEVARENEARTAMHMAEYMIVMEALTLSDRYANDPRMATLVQLVAQRKELVEAYIEQIPRTTAAMKVACGTPTVEASDVH